MGAHAPANMQCCNTRPTRDGDDVWLRKGIREFSRGIRGSGIGTENKLNQTQKATKRTGYLRRAEVL